MMHYPLSCFGVIGSRFYFAADKRNYTVGRQGADLELQADVCVSRSHAVLHVTEDHIELEDVGSKYGTFHNLGIEKNKALEKGHKVKLKINDLIRFGRLQNVWKVDKITFNTVTSSLAKEDVAEVAANVTSLGGKVLEQWSLDCTHLTMKEPSVTVKLLHALVDQKCVVTPKYWKDLVAAVATKKSSLPKAELYCPDFGDANMNVGCKAARRNLFKGTTFVFLSRKHFDMYGPIVKMAGGSCKDINSGVQKAFLIKKNVVVIQYNPSSQTQSSQTISTIAEFLQSHSKRIIPEYEIGLAILNCSLDEFCNPNHKTPETMHQTEPNKNSDNSMTVDLTEGETTPSINTESIDFEIPETNEHLVTSTPYENPMPCVSSQDKEDDQETMPNMHITETPVDVKNRKRRHEQVLSIDTEESEGDDLFQFAKTTCTKKRNTNIKDKSKYVDTEMSPKPSNKSDQDKTEDEKSTSVSTGKQQEEEEESNTRENKRNKMEEEKSINPRIRTVKKSAFADFLEKTQNKNKAISPPKESENNPCSTSKGARKRPRIQVLGEDDNGGEEDDLFCFGDTQINKKKRKENHKSNNPDVLQDEEDDLFGFKQNEPNSKQSNHLALDEDSNDMQATEKFVLDPKPGKTNYIKMPKPKILPLKISAIDWISGSLGKINIKNKTSSVLKCEDVKCEGDTKPNIDDLNMTEEHRKWLDSLKNAIEIQEISVNSTIKLNEKSNYKFRNQQNSSDTLNVSTTNFKTFVKKYQPSQKNLTVVQLHLL